MLRVSLRGVRAHLVRFAMSVLAVTLGVAFVAGTFALRSMLSGTFDQIIATSLQADAYLRGTETTSEPVTAGQGGSGTTVVESRNALPLGLADELAGVDGVAAVVPDLGGNAVLVGADGTAVSALGAPTLAFAVDPHDRAVAGVTGRLPQGPGEFAIERTGLERSGLRLGDTTTVVLAGQLHRMELVGIVDYDTPMAGATLIQLDRDTAAALFAPEGTVETMSVYAADGVTEDELVAALDDALAGDHSVEAVSGSDLRAESLSSVQQALGFVSTFLLVFASISLFVGAFIIANTFAMQVRQRLRELALLRAIGASPTQVFVSVLVQAGVVGLVGAGLGVVAGIGLVVGIREVLAGMGMPLAGEIPVDTATVVISVLVGTLVSLLAAAVPARRAALTPPVEAMREEVAVHERGLRVRGWSGLALLAAGAGAVGWSVVGADPDVAGTWLGVGAAAVVIAMVVVAPVIARTTIGVLAAPAVAWLRPVGRLARGNVVRFPRRTANTAGALMIGMALVGAAAVLAASTTASISSAVESEADIDLVLQAASGALPPGALADVSVLPEVATVQPFTVAGVALDGEPGGVAGMDPAALGTTYTPKVVDGDAEALTRGEVAALWTAAEDNGWQVGDRVTVTGPLGEQDVTIGVVIETYATQAPLLLPQSLLDALVPPDQQVVVSAFVGAADGVDSERLRAAVTAAVSPYVVVAVMDAEEYTAAMAGQVEQVMVILYALLGLSIVIAVLGIVNTLALSVIERTREIGLLRAVGLGRLQLAGTVTVESVLTAVFGTVVGLAVGVALAAALPPVFADQGLRELSVPWTMLAGLVALSVVVGVLAAVALAVRAARLPVLEAISYE